MGYKLLFSEQAIQDYDELKKDQSLSKRFKAVRKALAYLEHNPRHPSLQTHEFTSLSKVLGRKVFEAYAENQTSSAYRIFWCYGPNKGDIIIIAITG